MAAAKSTKFAGQVVEAAAQLRDEVAAMNFADPVAFVYNPLDYAWDLHCRYLQKWGGSPRRVLFLGTGTGITAGAALKLPNQPRRAWTCISHRLGRDHQT